MQNRKNSYAEYSNRFKQKEYAAHYHEYSNLDRTNRPMSRKRLLGYIVAGAEVTAIARLLPSVGESDWILDAPCGSGKAASILIQRSRLVVGIDSSKEMLARSRDAGYEIKLVSGDLTQLPIRNESAEIVLCNRFLHRIPPELHQYTLRELRRVCRRYGIFYFATENIATRMIARIERLLGFGDRGLIYYLPRRQIRLALKENGWEVLKTRSVLPLISSGYIVLAQKVRCE